MTQEVKELKKQLKQLKSEPNTPHEKSDNKDLEDLRQSLERETIERLLREDDIVRLQKELVATKKQFEEGKLGNKELKEVTVRLRAVEDDKV